MNLSLLVRKLVEQTWLFSFDTPSGITELKPALLLFKTDLVSHLAREGELK